MSDSSKSSPLLPAIVVAIIAGAAIFALTRSSSAPSKPSSESTSAPNVASAPTNEALPPGHPNVGPNDLPPGHPSIAPGAGDLPPPSQEPAAIVWTVPSSWQSIPNASAMRLATYEIAHVQGDLDDPQLSVIRAGGDTESNIQRWIGQFDEPASKTAQRSERTVSGFKVSVLSIVGTYSGGMGMGPGGSQGAQEGWALTGAIVETPAGSYFFKMTGPQKSVAAARPAFDDLVGSIKPAPAK